VATRRSGEVPQESAAIKSVRSQPTKQSARSSANPDLDRSHLLRFAYGEVLDATKHQDDKINRLLVTIAFLTAATLALANLGGAVALSTYFRLDDVAIPLPRIALAVYLLGVAATVVMLVNSLTTPVKFPDALRGPKRLASQFYFLSIAERSNEQWKASWERPEKDIADEHSTLLVSETRNIALRAEYKYDRTTEAVAVLSFSLLAFSLTAVTTMLAIRDSTLPGEINLQGVAPRLAIAAVNFGYIFLTIRAALKNNDQSVEALELTQLRPGNVATPLALRTLVWALASFPAILIFTASWETAFRFTLTLAPGMVAITCLLVLARGRRDPGNKTRASLGNYNGWMWGVAVPMLVVSLLLWALDTLLPARLEGDFAVIQFSAAHLAAATLLVASLARQVTLERRRVMRSRRSS
jgi:hypothetical protein